MGGISFGARVLPDTLTETAGYKAGLALSLEALLDHVSGSRYVDVLRQSEEHAVRLRAEEFEEIFYLLMHRIGFTDTLFNGDTTGAYRFKKYGELGKSEEFSAVMKIILEEWPKAMEQAHAEGSKGWDPRPMLHRAFAEHGRFGADVVFEQLEVIERSSTLNPHTSGRPVEWREALPLEHLFRGNKAEPQIGAFIDQRFVDYLQANPGKLAEMHWREFEKLAAEFYDRQGYKVDLGPGSGDDGVDVRVWKEGSPQHTPLCIIQCKRQKEKIEKVIVKGLAADVQYEQAEYGVLVTTSELAPGARAVITTRGYPIKEVNKEKLAEWLTKLRSHGSGIIRR
jgi:restriction system protein